MGKMKELYTLIEELYPEKKEELIDEVGKYMRSESKVMSKELCEVLNAACR